MADHERTEHGGTERSRRARSRHVDLLRGSPALDRRGDAVAPTAQPSRVDQMRELLDLVDRGLLSEEEFERQQAKISGS
jgi:hypothetical protein